MSSKVRPVSEGFHTVSAHLVGRGAMKAIEFYTKAFGAVEISRSPDPGGQLLMHAVIRVGDSMIMLGDELPMMDAFWGDRYGRVTDPFGYEWEFVMHKEDVSPRGVRAEGRGIFQGDAVAADPEPSSTSATQ